MTGSDEALGIVERMKNRVTGAPPPGVDDGPVVVVVRVTANAGKERALRELIIQSAGRALAAPGNGGFILLGSAEDPADFTIIEQWRSRAYHAAHENDPAMSAMAAAIAEGDLVNAGPKDTFWTQLMPTLGET